MQRIILLFSECSLLQFALRKLESSFKILFHAVENSVGNIIVNAVRTYVRAFRNFECRMLLSTIREINARSICARVWIGVHLSPIYLLLAPAADFLVGLEKAIGQWDDRAKPRAS